MQTTWQQEKLADPVFDPIRYHEQILLATTSDPFLPAFVPPHHAALGVEYKAVSAARGTSSMSGKRMMALFAFFDAIKEGLLGPGMTGVEASSGNTGPEMQMVAMQLGITFILILQNSMPRPKLERASVLVDRNVQTLNVSGGGAKLAREMGNDADKHNFDQYRGNANGWNATAQGTFLAPQVFAGNEDAAAIVLVGGSWGTALGFRNYVKAQGLRTKVVPVIAAGRQDISGGKNMEQTEQDILESVFPIFPKESILRCPRDQATLLSWLSWPYVVSRKRGVQFMFGQSFGATVRGAYEWVEARIKDGTLDSYRNAEGKVVVLTFGMDDFQGYTNIYLSELPDFVLNGSRVLPSLEELFQFGRVV